MLKIVVAALALMAASVHADDQSCAVKGMHCADCVSSVKTKICDPAKFSTCDVDLAKGKKDMGQIHIVTKDATTKIDQKELGAKIKDAGYTLDKCAAPMPKAKST